MAMVIGHELHFFVFKTIYLVTSKTSGSKGIHTEPLNSEFGHDGSPIEWLNPTRHKFEGEKARQ